MGPDDGGIFKNREQLKMLLLLLDIRRIPNEDDARMIDWAVHNKIPLILVLTKVDKVSAGEKKK